MLSRFEELDYQLTPMGELTLRRRRDPQLDVDVYEVKLGEAYLMSSLFTVAEEDLATRGLSRVHGDELDVLVGGLGLGYTAVAALADERVASLTVVDTLPAVIDWHVRRLLPVSATILDDPRASLVLDDFFALMRREPDFRYDAILVDIDHSPVFQLDPSHADLYTVPGLLALTRHLKSGGVFALWSDDAPDPAFEATLAEAFATASSHVVRFDNPLTGGISANTVYLGQN